MNQRAGQARGFFNRIGRRWDELRTEAFGTTFAMEAFIALLPREWTVADIGTGTGHLLPALSSHFAKVIAIEPAEVMLECARQRATGESLSNVELRNGDLTKLPADDECVDLAIAVLVLHHVPNPNEALAEMARVVRPGARVLIVEQESHENQAFYERMQDHWWGFDPKDLERRLVGTGFERVSCRRLLTAASDEGSPDSPSLFVLTGFRNGCDET
ncbi:MAG: class I SAM-dependent methyltransferase [Planctomycetes bacterium]|nr:class I SAM-dependent methyltransferase [Planctomycetota bacterium]